MARRVEPQEASLLAGAVCPLCGSGDLRLWLDARRAADTLSIFGPSRCDVSAGRILRCRVCGLGFRHLRPSNEELIWRYAELPADLYDEESPGRGRTAARHVRILRRYARPGRLLDVGCASGAFLCATADAGWRVIGVEPARALCERAAASLGDRGQVICASLEEAASSLSEFDVITLWDVLEHVEKPIAFLQICVQLLKPGGHLLVNVPDLDSMPARLLGARWPLLLPEHLNYFNRKSLRQCAEFLGLQWLADGRRLASFSVDYLFYRIAQHGIPLAAAGRRLATVLGLSRRLVTVPLGELYAVWRR